LRGKAERAREREGKMGDALPTISLSCAAKVYSTIYVLANV